MNQTEANKIAAQLHEAFVAACRVANGQPNWEFPCGGSWLTVPGTSKLARAIKMFAKTVDKGYGKANEKYEFPYGYMRHGYPKGMMISFHGVYNGQSQRISTECDRAAAEVLRGYGHEVNVHSYID